MKTIKILFICMAMIFTLSCQQKKSESTQSKLEVNKSIVKPEPNKIVFENLDMILSPFEDMTEFALAKNKSGILKSLTKIEDANAKGIFEKTMTAEGGKSLNPKIAKLKELISQNNFSQIALASTDIFEFNISNFADGKLIENQIRIEHLDYMGFKTLALSDQDKIDWENIKQTIDNTQKVWLILSPKVKNNNLKDTFDYLFKGLMLSADNKDIKMCRILANMDLALVDVLENSL